VQLPVGRITGRARPSVCMSVRPVRAPSSKTRRRGKPEIGANAPQKLWA